MAGKSVYYDFNYIRRHQQIHQLTETNYIFGMINFRLFHLNNQIEKIKRPIGDTDTFHYYETLNGRVHELESFRDYLITKP